MILELFWILAQIFLGWMLADFFTGFFHWLQDRFGPGREHWLAIGQLVFVPNQAHHRDPVAFLANGFVKRNWTTWVVAAPLTAALLLLFGSHPWIWAAATGGLMAAEFHTWTHRRTMVPRVFRKLQDWGVIQSPRHHAIHHIPDHRRNYCAVTDWLNPLLEHVNFWGRIEGLLPARWFL